MVGPIRVEKRDRIVSGVKLRVRKDTYKYGIKIPTLVKDAIRLDK